MATKPTSAPKVRPHDVQVPPAPKPLPPGVSRRRPIQRGAERTAQKLIHETGSVPKAKKAIDSADEKEGASDFREDQLALRLAFRSRKDMLAASKPLDDGAGESWWATKLPDDSWVVWNQETFNGTKYSSFDEAKQSLFDHQPDVEHKPAAEPKSPSGIPDIFVG